MTVDIVCSGWDVLFVKNLALLSVISILTKSLCQFCHKTRTEKFKQNGTVNTNFSLHTNKHT